MKFARSGAAVTAGALVLWRLRRWHRHESSSSGAGGTFGSVRSRRQKRAPSPAARPQENAMEQFVYAYVRSCPELRWTTTPAGPGAGVTSFSTTKPVGSDVPVAVNLTGRRAVQFPRHGTYDGVPARSRSPTISRA